MSAPDGSGPELRAVPPPADPDEAGRDEGGERSRRGPWLLVLLVASVAILGVGYALERSRASDLADRVGGLESELQTSRESLQTARVRLQAAERRMDAVRTHVADLADRIGLLQEVVAEPSEGASTSSPEAASASSPAD